MGVMPSNASPSPSMQLEWKAVSGTLPESLVSGKHQLSKFSSRKLSCSDAPCVVLMSYRMSSLVGTHETPLSVCSGWLMFQVHAAPNDSSSGSWATKPSAHMPLCSIVLPSSGFENV